MSRKPNIRSVTVREMGVDDIPVVYRLGHRLFKTQEASTFYRTWDAYEVTNNFNQEPHLTLVAESQNRIIGFALGTTYENESGGWKYGYILWIGVSVRWQRSGLGAQLYREMERRMQDEGVRMAFVDTARSNAGAIKFFQHMGYGKPEAEVWMSKLLQKARKSKIAEKISRPLPSRLHVRREKESQPWRKTTARPRKKAAKLRSRTRRPTSARKH